MSAIVVEMVQVIQRTKKCREIAFSGKIKDSPGVSRTDLLVSRKNVLVYRKGRPRKIFEKIIKKVLQFKNNNYLCIVVDGSTIGPGRFPDTKTD